MDHRYCTNVHTKLVKAKVKKTRWKSLAYERIDL